MRREIKIDLPNQNNVEKQEEKLEDLYINKDLPKIEDDNKPYTSLNKAFNYTPYSALGGVRPYSRDELRTTSTRMFNREMDNIYRDKESRDLFYQGVKDFQEKEVAYLKKVNKNDHIKKMFSTLNFKTKDSTYNDTHEFDIHKKKETLQHDYSNHYKKSFMKTYEEIKLKQNHIIRK